VRLLGGLAHPMIRLQRTLHDAGAEIIVLFPTDVVLGSVFVCVNSAIDLLYAWLDSCRFPAPKCPCRV
jgi:hypothetical protein